MFKTILVPLDGSALAERAVAPARRLAAADTKLVLLRAIDAQYAAAALSPYGAGLVWPDGPDRPRREVSSSLAALRASLPADMTVESYIAEGDAASAILDTAREAHADLIVMSSHGYTGLTRWVLGSVTEKVLRAAPCPVLVVRGTARFEHILITLDGSPLAQQALAPALAVAAAFGSQVTLLRAVNTPAAEELQRLNENEPGLGQQLVDSQLEEAEAYLRRLAMPTGPAHGAFIVAVPADHAAEAIARYAETRAIGLVAMATHGHTGLQRWTMGSVTEKVLRATENSMLVVRPNPAERRAAA